MSQPPGETRVPTEAVMADLRDRVRADLRLRLVARGAADDFADQAVFDEVDALFRRALARDDRHALLLPGLMPDRSRPELSLELTSHRPGPVGALIVLVKRRVLLPLTRWLFEYTLENFRVQDRVNLALMSCLQSLAADHAKLRQRVEALEGREAGARSGGPIAPPR